MAKLADHSGDIRDAPAMPVQNARHVNLRAVLAQLEADGIAGYAEQAVYLGNITEGRLASMDRGGAIDVMFAEHVEWVLHRRRGWMDELHSDDPLEA
ncbi:hypothetical protein KR767_21255 [Luteibacter anthropi]|uniref:Uncharacterized protein n=1 Tax=Luteibacter anthropi TaxID=564369 RepID=A0A7X5U960_9GAMM|nr:hypothetical protein [Luteibacter anthropi]NII06008.1 hypothetical protein [Luteibacter anthropi]URX62521.1 hypothetical protein KR767_21255 [Luteibacter anthropi]